MRREASKNRYKFFYPSRPRQKNIRSATFIQFIIYSVYQWEINPKIRWITHFGGRRTVFWGQGAGRRKARNRGCSFWIDLTNTDELSRDRSCRGSQDSMPPEHYSMWWGGGLRVQKYSGRIRIGRIFLLYLESGGEDGISGCGAGPVSGCNDIGGNPSGLFGGIAWTPKVSVSCDKQDLTRQTLSEDTTLPSCKRDFESPPSSQSFKS